MATYTNTQTITHGGVNITCPMVAIANHDALMTFEGGKEGDIISVSFNDLAIEVELDYNGSGEINLLPFIRAAAFEAEVLDYPLPTNEREISIVNKFRNVLPLNVKNNDMTDGASINVFYIIGDIPVTTEAETEIYRTYNGVFPTWLSIDRSTHYDSNGKPIISNFVTPNLNMRLFAPFQIPTFEEGKGFDYTTEVMQYRYNLRMQTSNVTYHFTFDARTQNVRLLKWVDRFGDINTRLFAISDNSLQIATSDSYERPHSRRWLNDDPGKYDCGKDIWANKSATETLTLGDDAIPDVQLSWLKELLASPCVELYLGDDTWQRANMADGTLSVDPRKHTFSISFTIEIPTTQPQQL